MLKGEKKKDVLDKCQPIKRSLTKWYFREKEFLEAKMFTTKPKEKISQEGTVTLRLFSHDNKMQST